MAEKEFLLAEQLMGETGDKEIKAWVNLSLLVVYTTKMQTHKAFNKIEEIKSILGDVKAYLQIGFLYLNEGINFRTIGKFENAITSFNKASEIWEYIPDAGDVGRVWRTTNVLFQKILLMNEMSNFEKVNQYFEELTQATKDSTTPNITLRRNFLNGLILKSKDRIGEKFQAQAIFQKIVDDQIFDLQIYSLSMLNLCDLLILEMKISSSPEERLNELITLVHRMADIGRTQGIANLMVMGEVIHGKINLIQNDLESARLSFEQAKLIAEEHNLFHLISKVQIEQDYVEIELSKWTETPTIDLTLSERIEKAQIQEYLTHAISVKERMVDSGTRTTN